MFPTSAIVSEAQLGQFFVAKHVTCTSLLCKSLCTMRLAGKNTACRWYKPTCGSHRCYCVMSVGMWGGLTNLEVRHQQMCPCSWFAISSFRSLLYKLCMVHWFTMMFTSLYRFEGLLFSSCAASGRSQGLKRRLKPFVEDEDTCWDSKLRTACHVEKCW